MIHYCIFRLQAKDYLNGIHFSVDDTIELFKDLIDNQNLYDSIFNNDILKRFRELHKAYGIKVTFYCFLCNNEFDIRNGTTKYKKEFEQNSEWIKFGFHGYNAEEDLNKIALETFTKEYKEFEQAIINIAGINSVDSFIRLSCFQASDSIIHSLKNIGVEGLYTADDTRDSYALKTFENKYIQKNDLYIDINGLYYISTDLRLDNLDYQENTFNNIANKDKVIEVFCHEWALSDKVITSLSSICKNAEINNYDWIYGADILKQNQ